MAGLKEIRRRISSVKNTRQITRAMKLVSAAKLKRAEEAAIGGRTFNQRLEAAIAAVLSGLPADFHHPLVRKERKETDGGSRQVIVIAGERGLCGAYNTNVVKAVIGQEFALRGSARFVNVGRRTVSTAKRLQWNVLNNLENLPENIAKWPVDQMARDLFAGFEAGEISEAVIYYTKFVSGLNQQVTREVLLPVDLTVLRQRAAALRTHRDAMRLEQFRFSPRPEEILSALLPLYVKAKIRGAALESKASEHASRMAAMDSATNNADELIGKLTLFYNRARQGAITAELLDIIGGAEALE